MAITIALIDDHLVFREAFGALLAASGEYSVVADASDARDICGLYEKATPEVVVMDVTLPGTDGLSATRELLATHAAAKVMIDRRADRRRHVKHSDRRQQRGPNE